MSDKEKNTDIVPVSISVESLKSKIYVIRNQKVMLSTDLAEIYGYDHKGFNRQINNNLEKFDEDFCFRLTKEEVDELRSKNYSANISSMSRFTPYAFNETGIYMLMTVLRGDLAVRQSKALIKAFKGMKDYLQATPLLLSQKETAQLALQVSENTKDISDIKENMITKDDLSKVIESFSLPDKGIEYVIYSNKYFDANVAYTEIYSKAKKKIYVVDNYIGSKTLFLLRNVPVNIEVIIFSDNVGRHLSRAEFNLFHTEYPNVNVFFQKTGGKFHDRYIIVDYKCRSEKVYHCGASSKDAGRQITTISQADNRKLYYPMIEELLQQPVLNLR